jgi:hypothetical protein
MLTGMKMTFDQVPRPALEQMESCYSVFADRYRSQAVSEEEFAARRGQQPGLLGIHGLKRSGKDTFATHYQEAASDNGVPVTRMALAEGLKDSMQSALGIPRAWVHGTDAEREMDRDQLHGLSGRTFMQFLGTEIIRSRLGQQSHAELVLGRILREPREATVLVTDVRFPNEAEVLRRAGGAILRIDRPMVDRPLDGHISERPLDAQLVDRTYLCESLDANRRFAFEEFERAQRRNGPRLVLPVSSPRSQSVLGEAV